jgi:hypothetical protein
VVEAAAASRLAAAVGEGAGDGAEVVEDAGEEGAGVAGAREAVGTRTPRGHGDTTRR